MLLDSQCTPIDGQGCAVSTPRNKSFISLCCVGALDMPAAVESYPPSSRWYQKLPENDFSEGRAQSDKPLFYITQNNLEQGML